MSNLPKITDPWPDCGSGQSHFLQTVATAPASPPKPVSESPLVCNSKPCLQLSQAHFLFSHLKPRWGLRTLAHPRSQNWSPAEPGNMGSYGQRAGGSGRWPKGRLVPWVCWWHLPRLHTRRVSKAEVSETGKEASGEQTVITG